MMARPRRYTPRPGSDQPWDCVIVGAGPAGSVLAGELARFGRHVLLLHRPGTRAAIPEETLVSAARGLLERHGLRSALRLQELRGSARHGVLWRTDRMLWREQAPEEAGFQVSRPHLDHLLRQRARKAGAQLLAVRRIQAGASPGELCAWLPGAPGVPIQAATVVLATGRLKTPAGFPAQVVRSLPETLALRTLLPGGDKHEAATVIEAIPEGWWWWLPLRSGGVCLTLFADAEQVRACGVRRTWRAALGHALGPARGLDLPCGRGVLATPRLRRPLGEFFLLGDAAATIDPLSSQGVEKALTSGEELAYVINTWLKHPDLRASLRAHQQSWEEHLFAAHATRTLAFYARERRFSEQPFWVSRHARFEPPEPLPDHLPACLRPSPRLAQVQILRRRGQLLEQVPAFLAPGAALALDHVANLPVAALLDLVRQHPTPAHALAAAARNPDLQLSSGSEVSQALLQLLQLGLLVGAEGTY